MSNNLQNEILNIKKVTKELRNVINLENNREKNNI